MASIKKRYKVLRNVEITLNSTKIQNSVLRNLEIEINEPHKNTFYFKGNYIGGLKVGKYTLEDKKEKISVMVYSASKAKTWPFSEPQVEVTTRRRASASTGSKETLRRRRKFPSSS